MVSTSALIRPTALRQLAHLAVDLRTSTLVVKLGHLVVRAPDEGGQIAATEACLPHTPLRHGPPQPPTGRGLVALPRRGTVPCSGGVEHLQRVGETGAARCRCGSGRNAVGSPSLAIRGGRHRVPSATRR